MTLQKVELMTKRTAQPMRFVSPHPSRLLLPFWTDEGATVASCSFYVAGNLVFITGSVCFFPQPLVDPIPNEAALEVWIGVEGVPVLVDVSGAVPHGVAVLAENERATLLLFVDYFQNLVDSRIHGTYNIR